MDLERFLNELKLVSEYFTWVKSNTWPALCEPIQIRGTHKNGNYYCPLTAVAFVTLGLNYTIDQWNKASKALNVSDDIASDIMVAADGGVCHHAEYDLLYEFLLNAVGIGK